MHFTLIAQYNHYYHMTHADIHILTLFLSITRYVSNVTICPKRFIAACLKVDILRHHNLAPGVNMFNNGLLQFTHFISECRSLS